LQGSIHSLSQQNSITMVPTANPVNDGKLNADIKPEIDESLQGPAFEDKRPAVFKSTRWEILAVIALVSAQLTNVYCFADDADHRNWRMHSRLLFLR
jgi:hypothetical protein